MKRFYVGRWSTVHPKAAKRFIPCTIWVRIALYVSLNRSAFIVAAAEVLDYSTVLPKAALLSCARFTCDIYAKYFLLLLKNIVI